MKDFEIIIAALPDRENEVAEIWYKGQCWVEVSQEKKGQFRLEFYNHPSRSFWEMSYEEAQEVLEKAKNSLRE